MPVNNLGIIEKNIGIMPNMLEYYIHALYNAGQRMKGVMSSELISLLVSNIFLS